MFGKLETRLGAITSLKFAYYLNYFINKLFKIPFNY